VCFKREKYVFPGVELNWINTGKPKEFVEKVAVQTEKDLYDTARFRFNLCLAAGTSKELW